MIAAAGKTIRVAIIDMNNGAANEGIASIREILMHFQHDHALEMLVSVFDLRQRNELPDLSYDIYLSSGGPGSPFDGENTHWEKAFFELLEQLQSHNQSNKTKKYIFLICYSFQLACRKYALGTVSGRHSTSFGIFPVTLTERGEDDPVYQGLPNPFDAFDNRDWQVIDADDEISALKGTDILALEKERLHTGFDRCLMSIRFSPEMLGTQFHPEANVAGMKGLNLKSPERIAATRATILPNFLSQAIKAITRDHHDR